MADMADVTSGIGTGAASGASLGPYGAIGGGLAGLGLALSMKKRKAPKIDINPMLNALRQGAERQRGIVNELPGKLSPIGDQFKTGVTGAENTAQTAGQAASKKFLDDLGKSQTLQGQELSDILKQRTLGALPELQANLRENLAASGGLQRGAASAAQSNLAAKTAAELEAGNEQIVAQQQEARNQALQQVYNMDESFIQEKLGIDKDTLTQLYNSGRQDLIDQANALLGIETNLSNQTAQLQEFAAGQGAAGDIAAQAQRQQLLNSLIGLGGTVAGLGRR